MLTNHRTHAVGTFEVTDWKEDTFDDLGNGSKFCRALVQEQLQGGIEGEGRTEYLMMYPSKDSACFVGIEKVEGRLDDRVGSFALQIQGSFDGRMARASWFVVPGSGTEELQGLKGDGGFEAPMGTKGDYVLNYEFEG